jgi:hypothetical protein
MDVNTILKLLLFIGVAVALLLILNTVLNINKPGMGIVFTVAAFPFAKNNREGKKGIMEPRTKLLIAIVALMITMLLVFGLWKAFEGGLLKGAPEMFAKIFG